MNDLIPIATFLGCIVATFGLVHVCEWLRPDRHSRHIEVRGPREAVAQDRTSREKAQ